VGWGEGGALRRGGGWAASEQEEDERRGWGYGGEEGRRGREGSRTEGVGAE
jgi:hypothetical protein